MAVSAVRAVSDVVIRPLDAPLGAEVECGDLRYLDRRAREAIHAAWLDHLVLVFRNQPMSDAELVEFTGIFGESEVAAVAPSRGVFQEVAVVTNIVENGKPVGILGAGELRWHSDHSFNERPLGAALLHAIEVPPAGGDTSFSNMYAALATMPPALRARAEGRTIKNDGTYNSAGEKRANIAGVENLAAYEGPSHPIVRTHPETGHNALYLGRRPNAYVNGLSVEDSEALLDDLWAHATQPRFAWTHRWRVGDTVVWDNRAVMHKRSAFDPGARRMMHRSQCSGERPYYDAAAEGRGLHPRATS
ncbi:MAG: TauD/TfdA dioxygenase family protein [Alphaproteobacteria bacterium]